MIEEQLKSSKEEDEEKKNNEEKKQQEEVSKGKKPEEACRKPVEIQLQEEGRKKKMNEKWREDEDVMKKTSENEKNWTEDDVKRKEENRKQHQHRREQTEERLRGRITNKKRAEKGSQKEDEEKPLEVVSEVNSKGEERKMESKFGLQGLKDEPRTVEEEEGETRGSAEEREKPGRRMRPAKEMEENSEEEETDRKMLDKSVERKREKTVETKEKNKLCESEDKREDEEWRPEEENHKIKQMNKETKRILQENTDVDNQDGPKRCEERWTDDDECMLKGKKPQEKSKNVNGHENGKVDGEMLQKRKKRVIMMNGGRDGKEDTKNKVMMISMTELQPEKEQNQSLDPACSSMTGLIRPKTPQNCFLTKDTSEESTSEAGTCAGEASAPCCSVLAGLPERAQQKRLSWRKNCISWSTLSLQNRSRPKGSVQTQRRPMKKADRLPPLCTDALLQAAGQRPLQEVSEPQHAQTFLHLLSSSLKRFAALS